MFTKEIIQHIKKMGYLLQCYIVMKLFFCSTFKTFLAPNQCLPFCFLLVFEEKCYKSHFAFSSGTLIDFISQLPLELQGHEMKFWATEYGQNKCTPLLCLTSYPAIDLYPCSFPFWQSHRREKFRFLNVNIKQTSEKEI